MQAQYTQTSIRDLLGHTLIFGATAAGCSTDLYPDLEGRQYVRDGQIINHPSALARVRDQLPTPTNCRFCCGTIQLVNNSQFYGGREYGWPFAYACCNCGARVGCHPGTDVPLGTLADQATMNARRAAHAAFDPLWKNKGKGMRTKAYRALSKAMGREKAHISWMDVDECRQVVAAIAAGEIVLDRAY